MTEILTALRDASPLLVLAAIIGKQAWGGAKKQRTIAASRHGQEIGVKPCPWCKEPVMHGTAMMAHMESRHK